ncbi:SA1_PKSA [Methylocaldum marinum]|uniref:SA1_PKSA n=1 Tax=Methylocaldum marinum TaxID=1432792 RepID=A0A250KND0_9GAMM|nr:type I polyketide synthase [Methylocaldum marinum]BBA33062.1 SA1_PKSA [Methylocaldum marinum]
MSKRIPDQFSTLVEILHWRALHQPERPAYTFLMHEEQKEIHLSYGELDRKARSIAAMLQSLGTPGARALLLHPPGLDYITALFGCLYAKIIAIPAYPIHPTQTNRTYTLPRLEAIAQDAGATLALTTRDIRSHMESIISSQQEFQAGQLASLRWIATDDVEAGLEDGWRMPSITRETLAYLQYTSGSTRMSKGVMVSHGNVIHNSAVVQEKWQMPHDGEMVSWLPLHHDLGLVAGVLFPFCEGYHSTLMSTFSFVKWPPRWLWAISGMKDRPVVSCAPNFAYQLCVRTMTAKQRESLDLSNWCIALNAAEPVRVETLKRFAKTFEPCGFRWEAFWPGYGLAEATLIVSGGHKTEPPVIHEIDKVAFTNNRIVDASKDDENACTLAGCGQALVDQSVAIVDPASLTRCAPGRIGEIWVSSPSVAKGYWNRAAETENTFQAHLADTGEGPFLRTGDLGYLHDGELFITGRLKDLIIIRGSNHYPQDIEVTVEESHRVLRPGGVAAFSMDLEGEERLIVVQEINPRKDVDLDAVIGAIRQAVTEVHELQVYAVVLIEPRTIPKTSSGKIQRSACRKAFEEGHLQVVKEWRLTRPQGSTGDKTIPDEARTAVGNAAETHKPSRTPGARLIEAWLIAQLAEVLGIKADEIGRRQPFAGFGLDSAQTVRLIGDLEAWLERPLSPTLAWEFPSVSALSEHLAGEIGSPALLDRDASRSFDSEPIAIIGLACRFPKAEEPETFWSLLQNGVDAITEIAKDRWDVDAFYDTNPATPGKMNTRWGGFLDHVDLFDADFFGISPREAASMDPQQRLILEVGWEALERAGQAADKLAGSRTGVFMGVCSNDYSRRQFGDPAAADAYAGTGNAYSITANRLSYLLDLRGPSLAVDTACSSSLVAVHYACRSLRSGECDMALAGGVNLILSPEPTVTYSQARMMASDGHCKTFDAEADGYVRGEGCGVIVLKRLSDALKDGDRVLAVVRGSAVNQDGRSNGLTAPNGIAQQEVIRLALKDAGVAPDQVSYVEAHGTGTPLGDPIEFRAITAVLGNGRPQDRPCAVGSVKTNIGHLEAAAGIAGLIKGVLVLQHEEIPPHLHLKKINPHIPLIDSSFFIATERRTLPRANTPPLVGVSSFGFGGTNAHVLLEQAPERENVCTQQERPLHLLTLSARTKPALKALAGRYEAYLKAGNPAPLSDICFTANSGRTRFGERLAVLAESPSDLQAKLAAFVAGQTPSQLWLDQAAEYPPKVAFLFTGQGAQHIGMGRELYESQPTFRRAVDRCAELLRPCLEVPLTDVLFGEHSALMEQTAYTQPALFALEYGLAELWRSWGIEPVAVLGHSIGEYVAAHVAGVFSLEDGLRLVAARGQLMQALPQDGAMVAVLAPETRVRATFGTYADEVAIAAVNGPESVVLSGRDTAVRAVVAELESQGVRTKALNVSHAFHSPLMEPILDEFRKVATQIDYSMPRLALISNVSGEVAGEDITQARYWCEHIRQPVRFSDGMAALHRMGCEVFVELGPQPILLGMGQHCLAAKSGLWLPSLRPEREWPQILESLAALYVRGVNPDWEGFDRDYARSKVTLPTYPFERRRYWIEASEQSLRFPRGRKLHPLLGERIDTAVFTLFQHALDARQPAYLGDHRVYQQVVLPAAGYLEMALAAGVQVLGSRCLSVEDIVIHRLLCLPAEGVRTVQCTLTPEGEGQHWRIFSGEEGLAGPAWMLHAEGWLRDARAQAEQVELARLQKELPERLEVAAYYERLCRQGLAYGPRFQVIEALWRGMERALGKVRIPPDLAGEASVYRLHPVLLDGALQVLMAALGEVQRTYLPLSVERFTLLKPVEDTFWSDVRLRSAESETVVADLRLLTDDGRVLALIEGLRLKSADRGVLLGEAPSWEWLYELAWRPQETELSNAWGYLPAPKAMTEMLESLLVDTAPKRDIGLLGRRLDALSIAYILKALRQLGLVLEPQLRFSTAGLAKQLGIVRRHEPLLDRLLARLAGIGILQSLNGQWEVIAKPGLGLEPEVVGDEMEMVLLRRCGSRLAEVLQGNYDPSSLLFPEGDLEPGASLFPETQELQLLYRLVQRTLSEVLARMPIGEDLRILEIGAGTGSLTRCLLPGLPAGRTEYVFTDISTALIARARQQFFAHSFVDYRLLDIEQSPQAQGIAAGRYQLVVAANVLHATSDLRSTLSHARSLLAPGGLLLLIEVTAPPAWLDLTFGLTDAWWRLTDTELRPNCPFLPAESWQALLREIGFAEPLTITPPGARQSLILAQAVPEAEAWSKTWLVLTDSQGVGELLAEELAARGEIPLRVLPGTGYERLDERTFRLNPGSPADYRALLEAVPRISGVVQCWPLDAASTPSLEASDPAGCASTLHLVKALTAQVEPPPLWLVTRGAVGCPEPTSPLTCPPMLGLNQSPLWGFGQVIALEHPELGCVRVDLDPHAELKNSVDALLGELMGSNRQEDQIAWRGGVRHVARLVRKLMPSGEQPLRLEIHERGTSEGFALRPMERRRPEAGEVEIQVQAMGLNFIDILDALGLLPFERHDGLGGECAGEVVAVGAGVGRLKVGDRVVALAKGCFGTYVTTPAELAAVYPVSLDAVEAASIPIAFLTAWYALRRIASVRAGERVLVHAAAGGTGMAAVQIALQAGAEVYATASPSKWEPLRAMGVSRLYSSRNPEFGEAILKDTGGAGVDVVLNSLTGEGYIRNSLAALRQGGRFVEIAKRDIWTAEQMAAVRPDVSYTVLDLLDCMQREPATVGAVLQEILDHFANGLVKPLPRRVFPLTQATEAFRFMQQARHVGKIVMVAPGRSGQADAELLRADGSYLITGGFGGLGLKVAQWLVERGARHLVLVGRQPPNETARARIQALEEKGAKIIAASADVVDREQLGGVLARLDSRNPLRGVIHAAAVLDDGGLASQNWERYERVLGPKILGAWNLHTLTQDSPLDFFVLFSSVASLLGSKGQSNYAAGNAFLDALAHYRRALGLPGLSINWGPWAEVGVAARRLDQLKLNGMGLIAPEQGLDILEQLLKQSPVQVAVAPISWPQFGADRALLSEFRFSSTAVEEPRSMSFLDELMAAPVSERHALLTSHVQAQVAQTLGHVDKAEIQPARGFADLGMDSLTSVELRNRLQTSLGCKLPPTLAFDYPTVDAVVGHLVTHVLDIEFDEVPVTPGVDVQTPDDELEGLSQAETAALLAEELALTEQWKTL